MNCSKIANKIFFVVQYIDFKFNRDTIRGKIGILEEIFGFVEVSGRQIQTQKERQIKSGMKTVLTNRGLRSPRKKPQNTPNLALK